MLLGPEFPLVAKIKDQYHKRILLKINREYSPTQVRNLLKQEIDTLQYPLPIVDHSLARNRAIEVFKHALGNE